MSEQTPDETTEQADQWTDQATEQTRPLSTYQQDPEPPPSRRHPLEVTYLVVGLVFLGSAVSWLLRERGLVDAGDDAWFLPLTLVLAGAIGLGAWVASTWRRGSR